jgi:hypothetical protein
MLRFFYVLFLAEPLKLSIFSHDIYFDFRLNHEKIRRIDYFLQKKKRKILITHSLVN